MKAIILAAGYATRLYPLTENMPKALLPLKNKPIINYIIDKINDLDTVNEIIIVSNKKFYNNFIEWNMTLTNKIPVKILNDGTDSVETRLGAIGDIFFAIKECNIDEEIIIIAGDNYFTYSLKDYYNYYKKIDNDCICVKKIENIDEIKKFAVVLLDKNNKVIDLEEKPQNPKSNLAAFATYIYKKDTVNLFNKYLSEGNNKDAPGFFVEWLFKLKDVYAYIMNGECYDIGTIKTYHEVNEML